MISGSFSARAPCEMLGRKDTFKFDWSTRQHHEIPCRLESCQRTGSRVHLRSFQAVWQRQEQPNYEQWLIADRHLSDQFSWEWRSGTGDRHDARPIRDLVHSRGTDLRKLSVRRLCRRDTATKCRSSKAVSPMLERTYQMGLQLCGRKKELRSGQDQWRDAKIVPILYRPFDTAVSRCMTGRSRGLRCYRRERSHPATSLLERMSDLSRRGRRKTSGAR